MSGLFIDSSVFMHLFLDAESAEVAESILRSVEQGRTIGVVTVYILHGVSIKLAFARASEVLVSKDRRLIREAMKRDERVAKACAELLKEFSFYLRSLERGGLRYVETLPQDWRNSIEFALAYRLHPQEALTVAVMKREGINAIATFNPDFKRVEGIMVVPQILRVA